MRAAAPAPAAGALVEIKKKHKIIKKICLGSRVRAAAPAAGASVEIIIIKIFNNKKIRSKKNEQAMLLLLLEL